MCVKMADSVIQFIDTSSPSDSGWEPGTPKKAKQACVAIKKIASLSWVNVPHFQQFCSPLVNTQVDTYALI